LALLQRVDEALKYTTTLLPVIITIPAGVLKGSARMKSLFPAAVLPGWFLVAVAPFYSLFMIVVFVLIEQIVGNFVLVLGVGLLAFGPWFSVISRRWYSRPMWVAQAKVELAKASTIGGFVTVIGFALVIVFLLTARVEDADLDVIGSDDKTAMFTY